MSSPIRPTAISTFDAFMKGRKTPPISNKLADRLLVEGKASLPRIWTGTVVAYPKQGAAFGNKLEFRDSRTGMTYVLETGWLKGERGAAIVLESGSYRLKEDGGFQVFIPTARPSALPAFPQESGWCSMDPETALPMLGSAKERYLWRFEGDSIVAAARESGRTGWARTDVFLNQRPSNRLAVLPLGAIDGGKRAINE
ncbi:MAG: hypothetical protein AB1324_06455 [Candidatus Micrarchaeota archaeon]